MKAWLALALLLTACPGERVRVPGADPVPADQAAIVRGVRTYGRAVLINAVDGVTLSGSVMKTQEVELAPGTHVLEIGYVDGTERSVTNARLVLDAKPGGRYQAGASGIHEGFFSEFGKGLVGGEGRWTAWIEDAKTREVVAGQRGSGVFNTKLEPATGGAPVE
jgi:hypothetical protein